MVLLPGGGGAAARGVSAAVASTLPALRRLLLALLALGLLGSGVELVLLDHTEDAFQWVPIVLIAVGLVACGVVAVRPGPRVLWAFRVLMVAFVLAGGVGLYQHYHGNAEFELEMRPDLEGLELFKEAVTGATPALAPGMMAQLGLLGLAFTFRHPLLARRGSRPFDDQEGERR